MEGTGSVVFDHEHRVAYACSSERTSSCVLEQLFNHLDYKPCIFQATDVKGRAVYHTNVVLSIATEFVLVSSRALNFNQNLRTALDNTGRKLLELEDFQIDNFSANCLEVENKHGRKKLLISTRGWKSLKPSQQEVIRASCDVITSSVETIENVGGGGIRCMLAEIHKPL